MTNKNFNPYKTPKNGIFNLRAGALHSSEDILILAGLVKLDAEHTAHTVVLRWTGALPWYGIALNWSSSSCLAIKNTKPDFCILGVDGEFGIVHENELMEDHIGDDSFYAMAAVGQTIYVVGAVGRILRSEKNLSWKRVAKAEVVNNNLLEAVAAYSPDEVYAVGADGGIVLLRQSNAERIDSPTNLILSGICRGPDDLLYMCGQKGLILRGREHEWKVIEHGVTGEDFWDICTFQDRIFLVSTRFLYELKGDTLETIRFEHDMPTTFCKLTSASDDTLLSVGQRDAFLFDGCQWTRLI